MTPRELEHAPQLLQIVLMISRMRSVTWRRHGIFSVTLGKYKSKFGGGGGQREAMSRRTPGSAARIGECCYSGGCARRFRIG